MWYLDVLDTLATHYMLYCAKCKKMSVAVFIYPHQLYANHPALQPERLVVLIEDPLFFGDAHHPVQFHKLKLMLHRASMKRYADEHLSSYVYQYTEHKQIQHLGQLFEQLISQGIDELHITDPTDYLLERRLRRYCQRHQIKLVIYDNPNFINTLPNINAFYTKHKRYHQTDFYIEQRKRFGLLIGNDGRPIGGKWTFDTDNRKAFDSTIRLPAPPSLVDNAYVHEARCYVEDYYPYHPGQTDHFFYPTNHAEAKQLLDQFVVHKLDQFGTYQDAITQRDPFLFHSLISAALNIGLLSPQQVLDAALDYAETHPIRLASLEGFVRQILGWREFMRAVYVRVGTQQRTTNFFGQNRVLDERWYNGTTGIAPIDDTIHKAQKYAYAHHIERLMLLGNFMVLCEIHPNEVYRWFMEMFIDAYDWVMVPNVYGMSQYADGGLMTTKPYISSSNYIRKMSDYRKGDWMATWDGLYWRFIYKHRAFFDLNPRLTVMAKHLDRMSADKLKTHFDHADRFLETLSLC